MFVTLRRHLVRSEGASAVEYAVLLAAIAMIIMVTVFTLGRRVKSVITEANSCIAAKGVDCAEDDENENENPNPGPTRTRPGRP